MSKSKWAICGLTLAMIIWASSFLVIRIGLESFSPITLVTFRMTCAAVILGTVAALTKQLQSLKLKDLKYFLLAAFCEPFLYFVCEAYGLKMVSPTVSSVILSTMPLFTPLFAFFLLHERISRLNLLGLAVSLLGVLMLVYEKEKPMAEPLGLLALFIAVVAAIMYSILLRKIPSRYNTVTIVFYMFCCSLIYFVPAFFIVDFPTFSIATVSSRSVLAVIALALLASCVAFLLFSNGIRVIGATKANAFNNMIPGITAIMMWLIYGEVLEPIKIVGILIVVVGMFISQTKSIRIRSIVKIKGLRSKSNNQMSA